MLCFIGLLFLFHLFSHKYLSSCVCYHLLHHLCEGRRGGGGHLPKNRKVWDCLTPKRGAEYDKHIGAPPPHLKEKLGPITFIYSPHPQHQLRAGATDTNTKKLMTLAALQKSWMHLCTHSPVEGIDFPTVCVCVSHWWYSVVDCLQISACIINQHYTLEAILVTLGVFLHSYCTHPIYSFLID